MDKPKDCTCHYPHIVNRNLTGHSKSCPSHVRLLEEWESASESCPKCGQPFTSDCCAFGSLQAEDSYGRPFGGSHAERKV